MKVHELYQRTIQRCDDTNERYGQALMNILGEELPDVSDSLVGTLDDPFYRIKNRSSMNRWINSVLTTDCVGTIIGVRQL